MTNNRRIGAFLIAGIVASTVGNIAYAQRLISRSLVPAKETGAGMEGSTAAVARPSTVSVSKTAAVIGAEVCGTIRIVNGTQQAVTLTALVDSLEVHFPRNVPPPALPAGSTPGWFTVADVPLNFALPAVVGPGVTVSIDYCYPLCSAADAPGANSMRNVVSVTAAIVAGTVRAFTTRSPSFPPPILDCQACCTPDGSCSDTVAATCTAAGGTMQGTGTDCATTECPEACCRPDNSCAFEGPSACRFASGEPQGPGTDCETTQCCEPLGEDCFSALDCCEATARCVEDTCCLELAETGCTDRSHCCEESGTVALCEEGRCCAPNRAFDSCHDAGDCCDENATCLAGTCCIALGDTGCTNLVGNDCCPSNFGAVICESGKCCAPTGAEDSCNVDSDCCDPGATCNGGTCCVRLAETGCQDSTDCCEDDDGIGAVICEEGKCCAPNRAQDSCHDAADCCDENATCLAGTCCIALGATGCTNLVGNDCCPSSFGTVTCESGKCCAPTGADDSCFVDSDCCDPNAICNGGTCCITSSGTGCTDFDDCCTTTCVSGICCNPAGFPCGAATDCCTGLVCEGADCCIPTGAACSFSSECCDSFCVSGTCCNPPGVSCGGDLDCCGSSRCNSGECCIPQFLGGCTQDSDCCPTLFCDGGVCMGVIGP